MTVMEKIGGTVRKKNQVPVGLQNMLNKLAKLALTNSPCCIYECFAIALESDIDWRTLVELQLAPCEYFIINISTGYIVIFGQASVSVII